MVGTETRDPVVDQVDPRIQAEEEEAQLRGTEMGGITVEDHRVGQIMAETVVIMVAMKIEEIMVETGVAGSMKIGTQDRMDLR